MEIVAQWKKKESTESRLGLAVEPHRGKGEERQLGQFEEEKEDDPGSA
jgi:hypothetical protein